MSGIFNTATGRIQVSSCSRPVAGDRFWRKRRGSGAAAHNIGRTEGCEH